MKTKNFLNLILNNSIIINIKKKKKKKKKKKNLKKKKKKKKIKKLNNNNLKKDIVSKTINKLFIYIQTYTRKSKPLTVIKNKIR